MGYPTILSDSSPQVLPLPTTANSFYTPDSETYNSKFWLRSFVAHILLIAKNSMTAKRTHLLKGESIFVKFLTKSVNTIANMLNKNRETSCICLS